MIEYCRGLHVVPSMPAVTTGFALMFASVLTSKAVVHIDDSMEAISPRSVWGTPSTTNPWPDHPAAGSLGLSQVGMELDPLFPDKIVIKGDHAAGGPSESLRGWVFTLPESQLHPAVTNLTIEYTLRLNSPNGGFAATQPQIFFNHSSPGDIRRAILTPRAGGTFQWEVFANDALLSEIPIVAMILPARVSVTEYTTFTIARNGTGLWTVLQTTDSEGTSLIGVKAESPVGNLVDLDELQIRDMNVSGGSARPYVFWDHVRITSDEAPPELGFTNITVSDETGFRFDSQDGVNYDLQWSSNMVDWISKDFTIHGKGGTVTTFDPGGFDSNRHYRIVTVD